MLILKMGDSDCAKTLQDIVSGHCLGAVDREDGLRRRGSGPMDPVLSCDAE